MRSLPRSLGLLVACVGALGLVSCGDGDAPEFAGRAPDPTPAPSAPALGGPAAGVRYDVTLLHTNDLHAQVLPYADASGVAGARGGMARHATLVRALRAQADARGVGVLVVNGGDTFDGSLFYEVDGGAFFFRLLDHLGYDVVQVGNHDHQYGAQHLHDVLAAAFPGFDQRLAITWGNVDPTTLDASGTLPQLQVSPEVITAFENGFVAPGDARVEGARMDAPFANAFLFNQSLFFERGGVRIGVFGIDTDEVLYSGIPGRGELFPGGTTAGEGLTFHDPIASAYAASMVAYLADPDADPTSNDGADLIVAVSHLGLGRDRDLARTAVTSDGRGIDVIIGADSHARLNVALPVARPGGTTHIVQAGERGAFIGRLDLAIDPHTDRVEVVDSGLIAVDSRTAADPEIDALIAAEAARPGGVDERFSHPRTRIVGRSTAVLPGEIAAPGVLGTLVAEAVLAAARDARGAEVAIVGAFSIRGDLPRGDLDVATLAETLPLHALDRSGTRADAVQVVTLEGGLIEAVNPAALVDPTAPSRLSNITRFEVLLELIASLDGLLALFGGATSEALGGLGEFLGRLTFAGLTAEFDPSAPLFDRVDPTSLLIDGRPLAGREAAPVTLAMNSVLAEIALPIVAQLVPVERTPGAGLEPLFAYDPRTAETGITLVDALAVEIARRQVLDADTTPLAAGGVRWRTVDLTFDPRRARVTPAHPRPGAPVTLELEIVNFGALPAASGLVELVLDPTPDETADDPDGVTDFLTGARPALVARQPFGLIPAATATDLGRARVELTFPAPAAPGRYRIEPRLVEVVASDSSRPERVTGNNAHPALFVPIEIE